MNARIIAGLIKAVILCSTLISCADRAGEPLGASSQECDGDTALPAITEGWKLIWYRVFQHPVAQPPEILEPQVALLERANPLPGGFSDTLWVLDSQTGTAQWSFEGVPNVALPTRWFREMTWSGKYLTLYLTYDDPSLSRAPLAYLVVLDRTSGQILYSDQPYLREMAVTDEALFFQDIIHGMNRVDLPSGRPRWQISPAGDRSVHSLIPTDSWLYSFNVDLHAYQYDSLDGTLVATATLAGSPLPRDVLIISDTVVARSSYMYEGVARYDLPALAPRWTTSVSYADYKGSNAFGYNLPSIFLTSDSVYLFDALDNMSRLDLSTGQVLWTVATPSAQAMSRPVAIDDLAYGLYSDGTLRAFSVPDGSQIGIVMTIPLWYREMGSPIPERSVVGGLGVAGDTLIITTGCRSVYAIQREN